MGTKLLEVKQSVRRRQGTAGSTRKAASMGMLPALIGYQLRLAQRAIFADFVETVDGADISPGLFGILVIIDANAGLTQQALADAAHLDRSTVVTVLDKLEDRALVERHAADRRSNGLFLTADGSRLLRLLKRKVAVHERRVVQNLSLRERKQLVALLQRILPEKR
ncbi:MAG TPA: MarR family transcriptional regulator [Burkholderiales bacterium]|nr:MarR family transcriptional regulator [Burkholderiales bacterium]